MSKPRVEVVLYHFWAPPARLNEGDVKRHTLDRLDSFVDGAVGKRLTYKSLIA